ncbi:Fanconi anemia group J protein homolog isoform X1 [Macrobrachium rosenbergii]|uniref:Fanconi anemia group J protein homolog isoform X1 n=2 Tax=Macrobrachium rosenbergii TaxID=79674 RepID=UPI0034D3F7C1
MASSSASGPPQKEYIIGGVKVLCPVKPYPSQMAMMAQIVKGLQRRQNCLLESPTGSGKSLALLCSTLAWHQAEKEKAQKYNDLIFQGITDPDILARAAGLTNLPSNPVPLQGPQAPGPPSLPQVSRPHDHVSSSTATQQSAAAAASADAAATGGGFIPGDEFDTDFRSQTVQFRNPIGMGAVEGGLDETMEVDNPGFVARMQEPTLMKVPKIYFGTRTHKQIYQIMRELRRTAYKHVRTTVLSSREHTCIHPTVSKMPNKNEGCQLLIDPREGPGCRFNHGVNKIKTHDRLSSYGIQDAWDIEDLVVLGKKIGACPYFSARSLKETADIIFCPYNYLIDPLIRDSMSIDLKNQIIVLDEAHNIEDSARDSVSCTMKEEEFAEAIKDFNRLVELDFCKEECNTLSQALSALSGWIELNKDNLNDYKEFDRSGRILSGTDMVANLTNLKLGPDRYEELRKCFQMVSADQDPEENNPRLKGPTTIFLKSFFLMLNILYMDEMKFRDDYRIALVRTQVRTTGNRDKGGYYRKNSSVGWEYLLHFWCLNPAVAFLSIGKSARSVILTSGTLSPMSSFQSELSVPFQIQLEANHVIDKNQVWVGTVGRGPTDQVLQATYQNTETWQFQDEIGRLVLSVCEVVPRGVLCFLPSYSMLNKLYERWQSTGLWDEISNHKLAVTEPRKSDMFESSLRLFYDTIAETRHVERGGGINGAFLMAVCRGKVSEGLDFTDDNARAVISIGIPFPNVKDIQVDLKRQYNNQHCRSRGLLPGSEWYEIQAYRALNQALGRCIRHRYDWGALILVDERFQRGQLSSGMQQTKYTRGLSKWVRNKIVHYHSFASALASINQFAENMIANPPVRPESLDATLNSSTSDIKKEGEVSHSCVDNHKSESSFKVEIDLKDGQAELSESKSTVNLQSSRHSKNCDALCITLEEEHPQGEDLNTTLKNTHNSNLEDSDFMLSEENLTIPPSRVPYTSTQISGLKDIAFPSLTQISQVKSEITEAVGNIDSPKKCLSSDQSVILKTENQPSFQLADISATSKVASPWFVKATDLMTPKSLDESSRPFRKRKSFSLASESDVQHNSTELKLNATKRTPLQSKYGESTEKRVLKDEEKLLFEDMEVGLEEEEDHKVKHKNIVTEADKGNSSSQVYNSDDDLFFEIISSNEPCVKQLKENIPACYSNTLDEKFTTGKDISESSGYASSAGKRHKTENKDTKNPHSIKKVQKRISQGFQKDASALNDSDMEDFCLEKSYSTPKVKKRSKPNNKSLSEN